MRFRRKREPKHSPEPVDLTALVTIHWDNRASALVLLQQVEVYRKLYEQSESKVRQLEWDINRRDYRP